MPALAIGAGIAAVGGVASSLIGSSAAKDAANIQAQSAANALNLQNQVFNWQKQQYGNASDYIKSQYGVGTNNINSLYNTGSNYIQQAYQPYMQAGAQATGTLSRLANGDYSSFTASPDYNFALQQGTRGVTNYENAQGMGMSGGALKDISNFNQGLATQQYGNYFNRLLQIATMGSNAAGGAATGVGNLTGNAMTSTANLTGNSMTATGNLTGNAMNSATNMSNSMANTTQGIGQAQASGVVGSANAWMGGINNATNNSILAAALGKNSSAYGSNNLGNLYFGGGSPSGYGTG